MSKCVGVCVYVCMRGSERERKSECSVSVSVDNRNLFHRNQTHQAHHHYHLWLIVPCGGSGGGGGGGGGAALLLEMMLCFPEIHI